MTANVRFVPEHDVPVRLTAWWPPLAVILLWALLFHESITGMVGIWLRSDTFAHGIVVAPISAWLAWRTRFWQQFARPDPTWTIAPLVLGFGGLWLAGTMVSVSAAVHIATIGVLVSALWGALGHAVTQRLTFPLGFLFLAAPVGEFLVPMLMQQTAEFTVWALRLSGIPVFQEGLHFVLPNGRWSVVEACSGIRYLIASTMVGALYAYLTYSSTRKRLVFFGFALVLPIVANWLRAYLIVLLGYLSGNRLAVGVDHLIYGWVFFGVLVLAMFWIGNRWRDDDTIEPAPVIAWNRPSSVAREAWVVGLVCALLALPVVASGWVAPVDSPVSARGELPAGADGWTTEAGEPGFRPQMSGYRDLVRQIYRKGDDVVEVWSALYANQVEGRELVSWTNRIFPDDTEDVQWVRLAQGTRPSPTGRVGYLNLRGPDTDRVIYYWYQIGGAAYGSGIRAKLALAGARLSGASDVSQLVVLVAPGADAAAAARRLDEFLASNASALHDSLTRLASSVR